METVHHSEILIAHRAILVNVNMSDWNKSLDTVLIHSSVENHCSCQNNALVASIEACRLHKNNSARKSIIYVTSIPASHMWLNLKPQSKINVRCFCRMTESCHGKGVIST